MFDSRKQILSKLENSEIEALVALHHYEKQCCSIYPYNDTGLLTSVAEKLQALGLLSISSKISGWKSLKSGGFKVRLTPYGHSVALLYLGKV